MKLAIAFLLCSLIPRFVAQAQDVLELQHNPLAADLPLVLSHSVRGSNQSGISSRGEEGNIAEIGTRYSLRFNRPAAARRFGPTRNYAGAGQATFFYFPQYARRASIGLTSRSKPALAPRPITYSPLSDPFYEEKALHRLLGDETPFYP